MTSGPGNSSGEIVHTSLDGTPDDASVGRWQGRLSISVTLATAIGLLVAVAALSVLALGLWSAQKNTRELLGENAELAIESAVGQIRQHLQPAVDQTLFVDKLMEDGTVDPNDHKAFGRLLLGALAAAPQIDAVLFIDTDHHAVRAGRRGETRFYDTVDLSADRVTQIGLKQAKSRRKAFWGPPVWVPEQKRTYMNFRRPVWRDGKLIGMLVAVVSVRELSSYLDRLGKTENAQLFLLYDKNFVLAHPAMAGGFPGRSSTNPVPALAKFSDPVLSSIWQDDGRFHLFLDFPTGTSGHVLQIFNNEYIFIYRTLKGFGAKPLLVGAYFRSGDVDKEIRRLFLAMIAGLVVLVLALIAAVIVGRRIARPIKHLSAEATRIGDLEISKVRDLPGSVFRELNEQSKAFNAMLKGLRWFELYVPRKLVEQLVQQGDASTVESDRRNLTVMFTDIAGFSGSSEGMDAAAVARFLNAHFALVADCIEQEGGTVDKFIGDSVMAFWGAPEKQKNRAERACRAALAIARAIEADNGKRAERGEPPVAMRIGIHSGPATVGNIGSPGRINYTIVGDTVNIGQRLEQLGKTLIKDKRAVKIVISEATAQDLGPEFKPISLGKQKLRGRAEPLEAFTLE